MRGGRPGVGGKGEVDGGFGSSGGGWFWEGRGIGWWCLTEMFDRGLFNKWGGLGLWSGLGI